MYFRPFIGAVCPSTYNWIRGPAICMFDASKKYNIFPMVVKTGDESHGIPIRKKSPNKQIQTEEW